MNKLIAGSKKLESLNTKKKHLLGHIAVTPTTRTPFFLILFGTPHVTDLKFPQKGSGTDPDFQGMSIFRDGKLAGTKADMVGRMLAQPLEPQQVHT